MMSPDEVLDLFRACGALLEGHFALSSGMHSSGYLQCAVVLQHPAHAERLGRAIAARHSDLGVSAVLSPAIGGIVIGHEVARGLGVRAIFAERLNGALTLRRGFQLSATDAVLVVEDVVTTGGSTRETIDVALGCGARVVGAAAIINRGRQVELGVPLSSLAAHHVPAFEPESCDLCRQGLPLVKPGSRSS